MTIRMLVFGAGVAIGRKMLLSAALIISAVSAGAAASPNELEQNAVCIPAAPSWLIPDQGLWGVNLAASGFGASAQPIPYVAETLRWAFTGTNGSLTPNPSEFIQGPFAPPLAGSLTPPPPATVGSGVRR